MIKINTAESKKSPFLFHAFFIPFKSWCLHYPQCHWRQLTYAILLNKTCKYTSMCRITLEEEGENDYFSHIITLSKIEGNLSTFNPSLRSSRQPLCQWTSSSLRPVPWSRRIIVIYNLIYMSTWGKPTQTQGECANSTPKRPCLSRESNTKPSC